MGKSGSKPRPLGYVAAAIIGDASELLDMTNRRLKGVADAVFAGDRARALHLLRQITEDNARALRALDLLLVNRLHEAEAVLHGDAPRLDKGQ